MKIQKLKRVMALVILLVMVLTLAFGVVANAEPIQDPSVVDWITSPIDSARGMFDLKGSIADLLRDIANSLTGAPHRFLSQQLFEDSNMAKFLEYGSVNGEDPSQNRVQKWFDIFELAGLAFLPIIIVKLAIVLIGSFVNPTDRGEVKEFIKTSMLYIAILVFAKDAILWVIGINDAIVSLFAQAAKYSVLPYDLGYLTSIPFLIFAIFISLAALLLSFYIWLLLFIRQVTLALVYMLIPVAAVMLYSKKFSHLLGSLYSELIGVVFMQAVYAGAYVVLYDTLTYLIAFNGGHWMGSASLKDMESDTQEGTFKLLAGLFTQKVTAEVSVGGGKQEITTLVLGPLGWSVLLFLLIKVANKIMQLFNIKTSFIQDPSFQQTMGFGAKMGLMAAKGVKKGAKALGKAPFGKGGKANLNSLMNGAKKAFKHPFKTAWKLSGAGLAWKLGKAGMGAFVGKDAVKYSKGAKKELIGAYSKLKSNGWFGKVDPKDGSTFAFNAALYNFLKAKGIKNVKVNKDGTFAMDLGEKGEDGKPILSVFRLDKKGKPVKVDGTDTAEYQEKIKSWKDYKTDDESIVFNKDTKMYHARAADLEKRSGKYFDEKYDSLESLKKVNTELDRLATSLPTFKKDLEGLADQKIALNIENGIATLTAYDELTNKVSYVNSYAVTDADLRTMGIDLGGSTEAHTAYISVSKNSAGRDQVTVHGDVEKSNTIEVLAVNDATHVASTSKLTRHRSSLESKINEMNSLIESLKADADAEQDATKVQELRETVAQMVDQKRAYAERAAAVTDALKSRESIRAMSENHYTDFVAVTDVDFSLERDEYEKNSKQFLREWAEIEELLKKEMATLKSLESGLASLFNDTVKYTASKQEIEDCKINIKLFTDLIEDAKNRYNSAITS